MMIIIVIHKQIIKVELSQELLPGYCIYSNVAHLLLLVIRVRSASKDALITAAFLFVT